MNNTPVYVLLLIIGAILALGPLWGIVGTVLGMTHTFESLAGDGPTETKTEDMADGIRLSLYTTAAGWIACPIGLTLVIVSAVGMSTSKKDHESE